MPNWLRDRVHLELDVAGSAPTLVECHRFGGRHDGHWVRYVAQLRYEEGYGWHLHYTDTDGRFQEYEGVTDTTAVTCGLTRVPRCAFPVRSDELPTFSALLSQGR